MIAVPIGPDMRMAVGVAIIFRDAATTKNAAGVDRP